MIPWIAATFLALGFVVLARIFGIIEKSREVVALSGRSLEAIRSTVLSDEEKESALQANALKLFRAFLLILFGGAFALLIPLLLVWACEKLGLLSMDSAIAVTLSLPFIATMSVLAILALILGKRARAETTSYSLMDRLMHRIAFRTSTAQIGMADIEDRMFSQAMAGIVLDRPVFITGLPRGGTTLLLESLTSSPEFVSHCYRDMPFVLIPVLWDRFSSAFRQSSKPRERAHGDGMLITPDSPEAFEEMIWKAFWKQNYRSDRILPWKNTKNQEFDEFFYSHVRKIIALRGLNEKFKTRYVSKNNLNIARLGMIRILFPDSVILVPFRHPLHHSTSLLEQHLNFLKIHREDPFASEYMRAIGHFDFGDNLRPIDFDEWLDGREEECAEKLSFWLEYWVATYKHLMEKHGSELHFINYEKLCADPNCELKVLSEAIGSYKPENIVSMEYGIHEPRAREIDTSLLSGTLLKRAEVLHARLIEAAIDRSIGSQAG